MKNFWKDLPRPFTVLAPLDGVTDIVFRQIIVKLGKPDVLFTEFTSVEGLQSDGYDRVIKRLLFQSNEQPIVAQIWGINPENFYKSAKLVKELGFSGIDINFGCPDKTVVKSGACSALIKNPKKAAEIIKAVKKGAGDLPVSAKTRIGFEIENISEWIGFLLQQNLDALTIHLRTVKELSQVPAHWELMKQIVGMRNSISPKTVLIGNGDITTLPEIEQKYKEHHCEGFMIGRGIFANPWLFNKDIDIETISIETRFDTFLEHVLLFEKQWGGKNFSLLKKFCKTYIQNFEDVSEARDQIMMTKSIEELTETLVKLRNEFKKRGE